MAKPFTNSCTKWTQGCAGGRGGKDLASERQKVTKHKGPDLASRGPRYVVNGKTTYQPLYKRNMEVCRGEGRKGPSLQEGRSTPQRRLA